MTSLGDDDPLALSKRRFGRVMRLFFGMSDIFVSVNPEMSRRFLKSRISHSKLRMIPNGVDIGRFKPPKDLKEKILKTSACCYIPTP